MINKVLVSKCFSNSIVDTLQRRLSDLFQPYSLDFNNSILLESALSTLKGCSVAVVTKVIKTWANAWATSCRFQVGLNLPFLFGCRDCLDKSKHYLQCPHLFALWKFLTPGVSNDPLIRWGLSQPSKEIYLQLACVFSGYHAVRRELKKCIQLFNENSTFVDGTTINKSWTVFAEAFKVEARELGVAVHLFSVPSFLDYLLSEGTNFNTLGSLNPDTVCTGQDESPPSVHVSPESTPPPVLNLEEHPQHGYFLLTS